MTLDPYYYAREGDTEATGRYWVVRGPNNFLLQVPDLDKNIAYIIAKLLSDDWDSAKILLDDIVKIKTTLQTPPPDSINHPPHYTEHPSGIECIQITEHMNFCIGNAIKYLWRADEKGAALQDLQKAAWYIAREIERRKKR